VIYFARHLNDFIGEGKVKNKSLFFGIILVLAAGTLFGNSGIFVNILADRGVSEMGISVMRLTFTFLLMFLYLLFFNRGAFRIKKFDLLYFIFTGMIGMVGSSLFYFYSIRLTSMSVAAVLMYTSPTIVVILSLFILREKLTWRKCLCCLLSFIGTALVSGLFSGEIKSSLLGVILGLLAGTSYALYSIFSGAAIANGCKPLTVSFYSFMFASMTMNAVLAISGGYPSLIGTIKADPLIILIAVGQSLTTCLLPYVVYTIGIRYAGASNASIMSTVEVVVASIMGLIVYKQIIPLDGIIGIVLVIASVVVLNIPFSPKHLANLHRKHNS